MAQLDTLNFYIQNDSALSGVPDTSKNTALSIANTRLSQDAFGTKYNDAVALLAAHILAMTSSVRGGGVGGSITAKKEGDLSVNFGSSSAFTSRMDSTNYGQMLQQLKRECIFTPNVNSISGIVSGNFGNG